MVSPRSQESLPQRSYALQRETDLGMPAGEHSTHSEAREMAQQAKVLATKPGEPSLIAGLPNNRR